MLLNSAIVELLYKPHVAISLTANLKTSPKISYFFALSPQLNSFVLFGQTATKAEITEKLLTPNSSHRLAGISDFKAPVFSQKPEP